MFSERGYNTHTMNEFVHETKHKLTLKEFEVLNTSTLDYVGNYMGMDIKKEARKLKIKVIFIEVSQLYFFIFNKF